MTDNNDKNEQSDGKLTKKKKCLNQSLSGLEAVLGDHLVWFTSATSPQLLYEFPQFRGENGKRQLNDYFQIDEIFSNEDAAEQKCSVSKEYCRVTQRHQGIPEIFEPDVRKSLLGKKDAKLKQAAKSALVFHLWKLSKETGYSCQQFLLGQPTPYLEAR